MNAFGGVLVLDFPEPVDNGGSEVLNYEVSVNGVVVVTASTQVTVTGLKADTDYRCVLLLQLCVFTMRLCDMYAVSSPHRAG